MHIGKGDKSSKTEFVFFPLPGFFERKRILPVDDDDMDEGVLVTKRKQESYKAIHKREYMAYKNLSGTRLIVALDGFVTFSRHFKYIGTWISFSLGDDHDVKKRLSDANASMGGMPTMWKHIQSICCSGPSSATFFCGDVKTVPPPESPYCFPRGFPAQGDEKNIDDKDVSGHGSTH